TYRTVLDVLGYGMILGFLIRAVEGIVLVFTAGVAELDLLGPLGALVNSALGTNSTVMIAVGLIFASVAEEMLHRGGMIYLCNLLQDKYGMSEMIAQIFSCIVQAFFFAVLHAAVYVRPEEIVALFAGGILYGAILFWKKDLSVCIVAHLTVNLTVFWPFLGQWAVENPAIALILGLVVGGLYYLFSLRGGGEDEI
ncbi:MAG: CPBP family intramembrane glutamic endopeptidase, partial [Candidatus Thorarchaeota archaeon]